MRDGIGCPACKNKAVIRGYNDVATVRPESIEYFVNKEDAFTHTLSSNKYVDLHCPYCGAMKKHQIRDFVSSGFSCPRCSDGKSYPNKFVFSCLMQLLSRDKIKDEYCFDWSKSVPVSWKPTGKKMIYDIYLPDYNAIIENHGEQHYSLHGFGWLNNGEQIKENDKVKCDAALSNGISTYVELDCRKSGKDFIKQSIMNSVLPKLLDFTEDDINWDECDKYASGSLLIECANLWNSGEHVKADISRIMHLSRNAVNHYLKKASKLNLIA